MQIKITESQDAKNARLNDLSRIIRREGKITERWDKEDETGMRSGFFVEYLGAEWLIRMKNGQTTRVKELWKIEE
jgi:hypothetical protein